MKVRNNVEYEMKANICDICPILENFAFVKTKLGNLNHLMPNHHRYVYESTLV